MSLYARRLAVVVLCTVCAHTWAAESWFSTEPMPQYDALFCRTDGWTGGDGVYSVLLGADRVLWLFSDTWIGPVVDGAHKGAAMVNNTAGVQQGLSVENTAIDFFWGPDKDGKPTALIKPADQVGWFWIFAGTMAEDHLYLFLMHTDRSGQEGVFGFKHIGVTLGRIDNPQDEPTTWRIRQHKVPWGRFAKNGNLFFGSAVLAEDRFLYIYGADEDWAKGIAGRSAIVARVPDDHLIEFKRWRFWDGGAWVSDLDKAAGLFAGAATEYSVSFQPKLKRYVAVYTENGMSDRILMRLAPRPQGPWGKPHLVYRCPDETWHKTYFCYAAKGHPEISADDELVVTYVCNSLDFWQMARDTRIYRPRFVKIKFHRRGR